MPEIDEQVALARVDETRRALDTIREIPDLVQLRDEASTIRRHLALRGGSLQARNKAAILTLRIERKLGATLAAVERSPGGRPGQNSDHDGRSFTDFLTEYDIARTSAVRWQLYRWVPDEVFEPWAARAEVGREEVTEKAFERLARRYVPIDPDPGLDKLVITVSVWKGLDAGQRAAVLARPRTKATFNEQKSADIEWAQWSWNPVTGCLHDCSYCYARDIAIGTTNRPGYPWGFVPAFLPERLGAPANTRVPDRAEGDIAYRNVFTCSMADLFGNWVPTEWIEAVLAEVRANPQWNFLFLTKFPIRLQDFEFPDNAWVGTTVDAQARLKNAERAFANVRANVKWLSCEPLLEPLRFERLDLFDWIVMGGSSRSTETPEWRPPRAWVDDLRAQARRAGCEVYEKTNLLERLREYPGQPEPEPISVPDAFKMPYLQRDVLEPDAYAEEIGR